MTTARGGCPLQLSFKVLHLGFGNLPQPGFLLLSVLSFLLLLLGFGAQAGLFLPLLFGFGTQAGLFLPLLLGFLLLPFSFLSPFGEEVAGKHGYCASRYGNGGTNNLEYLYPVPVYTVLADTAVQQWNRKVNGDGKPNGGCLKQHKVSSCDERCSQVPQ